MKVAKENFPSSWNKLTAEEKRINWNHFQNVRMTGGLKGIERRNSLHSLRYQREHTRALILDAMDHNISKTGLRKFISTALSNRSFLTRNTTGSSSGAAETSAMYWNKTHAKLGKYRDMRLKNPPKAPPVKVNRFAKIKPYSAAKKKAGVRRSNSDLMMDVMPSLPSKPLPSIPSSKVNTILTTVTGESKVQKAVRKSKKDTFTGKAKVGAASKPLTVKEKKIIAAAEKLASR